MNEADSLLGISVDQGLVGEHEASVRTQQEGVSHVGHGRRLGGPPGSIGSRKQKQPNIQSKCCATRDPDGHGRETETVPDEFPPLVHKEEGNDIQHVCILPRRRDGNEIKYTEFVIYHDPFHTDQ